MRTPFALALAPILVLAAQTLGAQSGGPCPEQRSTPVAAASQDLAPWRTCVLRVHVLGVVISIPNGRCPSGHTYVPAHEECLGEFGVNSACDELGPVAIELELCRCVWHGGTWVSFSSCECRAAGTMGFVTGGHTVECP
jgi:hypothetical protein